MIFTLCIRPQTNDATMLSFHIYEVLTTKIDFFVNLRTNKSTNTMKFIGIIPARYASTRFPAKPLAMLEGKL